MADLGTGYNPGNLDLATQQADIDRKRQVLQALLMQGLKEQPTQMAGQVAIRQGPMSVLGKVLTSYFANKGMSNLTDDEKALVDKTQQQQSDSLQELMNSTKASPGTPTKITEAAGPPDAQGTPSMMVQPGTPGGLDQAKFGAAIAKATRSGVSPSVIGSMLTQFQRNQFLSGIPGMSRFVPGMQGGGAPSVTPGTANGGAQLSIPAGAPAGGGGAANLGGVPGMAAGLTLSGDPALEKLGAMINEQAKPISGRAGAPLWGKDANGNNVMVGFSPSLEKGQTVDAQGKVSTSPGYVDSMKQIKTAEADVGASHQMATLKMPDGSEVQVPLNQALQLTGRSPPTTGPKFDAMLDSARTMSGGGSTAPPGMVIPPAVQQQRDAKALGILQQERANATDPKEQAAIDKEIGTRFPGAMGTSQSTAQKAFQEKSGGDLATQFQGYRDASDAATTGRATVAQMQDALTQFNPNAGAPARQKIAEILQAGGVSDDTVKKVAGGKLDAMQEFTKLAFGNSVSNLRALVGPGQRISQLEMLTNYKQSPNPSIQRTAAQTMLEMQDGGYKWAQDRNEAATAWSQQGRDPTAFNGWWNRNHPLTGLDNDGKPYIPTIADVRARIAAAEKSKPTQGLGTQQVSGGIGAPQARATVMRFDAQGNLVQ